MLPRYKQRRETIPPTPARGGEDSRPDDTTAAEGPAPGVQWFKNQSPSVSPMLQPFTSSVSFAAAM